MSAIAKATSYQWTLPTGATGTSNTNSITVNYSLSALSGNVTVKGINTYGDGGASTLAVTVNDIHLALCGGKTISGIIITETNKPVSGVSVILSGSESDIVLTGIDGFFSFAVMQVGNYTVTPFKTNDVATNNGVTTTDIALIRKHVINITPFNSPYKIIAADASNNSIASTADIPLVRQVILNNSAKFPGERMWEFVSSDQVFTGPPYNPFPFIKIRTYSNFTSNQINQNFIGVKLGDVNDTWNAGTP